MNQFDFCGVNKDILKKVNISKINKYNIDLIAEEMKVKQYFRNAILSGVCLGAKKIVYGIVIFEKFNFPVEHCWIEMLNGDHNDPTYQLFFDDDVEHNVDYYQVYSIDKNEYFEYSKKLTGSDTGVIDFFHLRRHKLIQSIYL